MDVAWMTAALTSLVVFIASLVHGIAGFGYAQVAMGLLPLFRSPGPASVVFTITAIAANWRIFWSVRDDFAWKAWTVPVVGLVVGLPIGIYMFQGLDEGLLRLVIGVVLLLSVVFIVVIRQSELFDAWVGQRTVSPGWMWGVTAGFFGGVLGGAVAIPGPPMILYGAFMLAAGFWSDREMKAVLTAFFGTLMVYRLGTLAVTADVTVPLTVEALIALPALLLGAWMGIRVFDRLPQHMFRWIVLGALTVTAVLLIAAAF
ncbi:MAG: sulfite exporter TauE/SafE family protein [Thermoplasmatota archaeon]